MNFFDLIAKCISDPEVAEEDAKMYLSLQPDGGPINRVVPRWKAIKNIPGIMPCEDIRELLRPEDGKLHTTRCFCRTIVNSRHCAVHEGTHPGEGHCIHFGKMADYYVNEMEIGRFLTWDEVMEIIEGLEKSPVYHMVGNSRDVRWICNCCKCCCTVARPFRKSQVYGVKDMLAPSRFLCTVDQKKCKGTQICVGKCPFDAIQMREEKAHIDPDKCMGCGTCVLNCPNEALKLKLVRPPEYIPEQGIQLVEQFILELEEPAKS